MLVSINTYYTKIQKVLTKYQSVERVTLFLLAGSSDLRTGHLAILWGRCRHVFHTRIRIL